MAMDLHNYFRLRCADTLNVLQNMEALFDDLTDRVQHDLLKELFNQHVQAIRAERSNLEQITGAFPKTRTKKPELQTPEGERLVMVGRGWVGVVETHRFFVEQVPQAIVDTNAALLAEEMVHFNLGNFTGLIVLAKQLGMMREAELLQQNIDHENQIRVWLEGDLWKIFADLEQGEMRKAA